MAASSEAAEFGVVEAAELGVVVDYLHPEGAEFGIVVDYMHSKGVAVEVN